MPELKEKLERVCVWIHLHLLKPSVPSWLGECSSHRSHVVTAMTEAADQAKGVGRLHEVSECANRIQSEMV